MANKKPPCQKRYGAGIANPTQPHPDGMGLWFALKAIMEKNSDAKEAIL
jgi:hypothetical protein